MKLFSVILLLAATTAQQHADKKCHGVYFSDKYYDIEVIKEGLNRIQQLLLNRNDNNLYFIFEQSSAIPTTAAGYINLDSREVGVLGIKNATCIAIDQQFNKVYIGGVDGIYRINDVSKNHVRIPVRDRIQSMFFKDVLFYTNDRNEASMYDNGHINPVFELQYVHPQKIILDDDHNIFFTEGTSLFRARLGTRIVNSHESHRTLVLTTDADGKPYISTKDGIYTYNKYKYVFDKVAHLADLKALTFNKFGDPIYAVADFIIKLKQNPEKCFDPIF